MDLNMTWHPSHLCLICTSSSAPTKSPISVEGTGEKGETSQIKCEPLPIINLDDNLDCDNEEDNIDCCNDASKDKDTSRNVVDHVKAVFVLRKLLNYPKKGCIKYLQIYGVNPGNWFTLCPSCNEKIGECYRLYGQLQKLEHKFAGLKSDLKNEICQGKDKLVDNTHRTKNVWQDIRDFVSGKQQRNIAPVLKKQPCSPEKLTVAIEPDSIVDNVGDHFRDDNILHEREPVYYNEDEDTGSDWEPEQNLIRDLAEPEDVSDISDDDQSEVELDEDLSEYEIQAYSEITTPPQTPKRKASDTLDNPSPKKTLKRSEGLKIESTSTVLRDPSINPHIPLPPERHHSYKCTLCVGFYYQRVKFDKHKTLHETQGGIPCGFCGWYHKAEYMRFHVNHFHNPDNPRVVKEGKRKYKYKPKNKKVEGEEEEEEESVNTTNENTTQPTNLQDKGEAAPIKKKKKKKWRKKKEEIVYYCDHCEMKCLQQRQMILHFDAYHSGKEKLCCTECNDDFVSSQFLQLHTNLTHPTIAPQGEVKVIDKCDPGSSVYNCSHCEEVFVSKIKLDYHLLKCHRDVKWTCHCGFRTAQYNAFTAHILTHTGDKPYACHLCDKVYRSNVNLKNHLRQIHHKELGIDPLICPRCNITCLTNQAYKVHMEVTHGTQKTHCCEICGKMSGTKNNLKKHMKTHENDDTNKPSHYSYADGRYTCAFCEVSYTQNKNIVKHLRNAHPERCEFKCAGCDTQYCSINGLRKHQALCEPYRQSQPEQAVFKCRECDQMFTVKNQLLYHRKKIHCKFECEACGLKVNTENMMVRHKSKCLGVKLSRHAQKKVKKLAKLTALNKD